MARISLFFAAFAVLFAVELMHHRASGQNATRFRECLAGCAGFAGGCGYFCANNTQGVAADQFCSNGCSCFFFSCNGACYFDYGNVTTLPLGHRGAFSGNAVNWTALKLGNGSAFSEIAVNKTTLLNLPEFAVNGTDTQ